MSIPERRNFNVVIRVTGTVTLGVFARSSEEAEQIAEETLHEDINSPEGLPILAEHFEDATVEEVYEAEDEGLNDATGHF